jgi:hypothetical protein
MLTLACYGNKLPGHEPVLTNEQVKKCIFQSFPDKWQQQFIWTAIDNYLIAGYCGIYEQRKISLIPKTRHEHVTARNSLLTDSRIRVENPIRK